MNIETTAKSKVIDINYQKHYGRFWKKKIQCGITVTVDVEVEMDINGVKIQPLLIQTIFMLTADEYNALRKTTIK